MTNKKLMKKLLATASTVAVLASGSNAFAAATYYSGGAGEGKASTGANIFKADGGDLGAPVAAAGHTFIFASADGFDSDVASAANTYTFNIAGRDAQTIKIGAAQNFAITNDVNVAAVPNPSAAHTANAAIAAANPNAKSKLNFTAAVVSDLKAGSALISEVDFANQAATLKVSEAGAHFKGTTFKSTGGINGTVQISGNTTFTDVVANANRIKLITVDTAKELTVDGTSDLSGGNPIELEGTGAISVAATAKVGNVTVKAAGKVTLADKAEAGDITLSDAGTLTSTGTDGANKATINKIVISEAGTATLKNTTVTTTLEVTKAGTVNLLDSTTVASVDIKNSAAKVTLDGANSTLAEVKLAVDTEITVKAGTITKIDNGAQQGTVRILGNSEIKQTVNGGTLNFGADATLKLSDNGAHKFKTITTAKDNTGSINLSHDLEVETVGAAGASLKDIMFSADKAITVTGTEFNVSTVNTDTMGGAAKGQLLFTKAVKINGKIGVTGFGAIDLVAASGADANLTFGDSLVNVAELAFDNAKAAASLVSVGNKAMKISANAAGDGKLTFLNTESLEIAQLGANGAELAEVNITKGNVVVTAAGTVGSKLVHFGKDASVAVLTVDKIDDFTKITTESKKGGTIEFRDTSKLVDNLGTEANSLTALSFVGNASKDLNLQEKSTYSGNITAAKADTLSAINLGTQGSTYGGLGTKEARLEAITFAAGAAGKNGTILENVFAKTITNDKANTTVVFTKTVDGVDAKTATLNLSHASAAYTFKDGANILNTKILAANDGNGVLNFEGNSTIGSDIGTETKRLVKVTISGGEGKVATLGGNVYVNKAAVGFDVAAKTTVALGGEDRKISGVLKLGDGAILDLGQKKLTLDTAVSFDGTAVLTIQTDGTETGTGNLYAKNLAVADKAKLTVKAKPVDGVAITAGSKFGTVLEFTDAGKNFNGVEVADFSRLVKLTLTKGASDNEATFTATSNKEAFIADIAKNGGSAAAQALAGRIADLTVVSESIAPLYSMLSSTDAASVKKSNEALGRLTEARQTSTVTVATVDAGMNAVEVRSNQTAGVASGDEALGFGVWAQGFGSKAEQKVRKGVSGYKSDSFGGTVGVDTQVNDSTTLGLAATFSNADLKFKGLRAGDKVKSENMFFTVYGRHDLGNNWFLQGAAGFGSGEVKQDSKRVISTTAYDIARGKFDTLAFSFEGLAGYNLNVAEGVAFIPTAGIRYTSINEGGYTEKGSMQNLTVTKKATDKVTGILGARLESSMDLSGNTIRPYAHAYVNHDFNDKAQRAEARLDGVAGVVDVTGPKAARTSYDLGLGLSTRIDSVEFGAGYSAKLSDKYLGHRGTLKVRVDL